jgi:FkbM family methyltransferase
MLRANLSDVFYGVQHPLRAARYLWHRDTITYAECATYLPPNPVIIEAGAFDGTNSREFVRYWPSCRVYAFEPVPSAYRRLESVAAEHSGSIFAHPLAVGRVAGTAQMHVSGSQAAGEQSSSLLTPTGTKSEFPFVQFSTGTIDVPVVVLDDWAAEMNIGTVDFFWLDLQGFELAALQGAERLLQACSAIHCEVQQVPLYQDAPLYPEVRSWLDSRGFRPVCEAIFRRGGNVLFARNR